jgi:hypothetical protein
VESLGLASLPARDKEELLAFQEKAGKLQRAMMGAGEAAKEAVNRLNFIKKAVLDTPKADPRLGEDACSIEKSLQEIQAELYGDWTVMRRSEPTSPSLMRRVSAQLSSTCAITATAKRNYEIVAADFSVLLEKLRKLIETDLKKLEEDLEAAGAPWTPGRGVPKWEKE